MKPESGITDVIIIGGSHSGLSAALTLYRARHTSLIFDAGTPRNGIADHVHMMPGWDGKDPNELREACRDELRATGLVQFVPLRVVSVTKGPDGLFEVVDSEEGHWKGRKILLAFGVQETFPNIEGFAENYGKYIYHCMFCLGYEKRGSSMAAVLAQGPLSDATIAAIFATDTKKFAKHVKIYTNGNPTLAAALSEKTLKGTEVDNRKVKQIFKVANDEIGIEFDEGPGDTLAFMVHQPEMNVDRTLPDQLGCECVPKVGIKINPPFNSTTAPGVYAAGDCCSSLRSVLTGMSMGSCAAVGIAREIPPGDDE